MERDFIGEYEECIKRKDSNRGDPIDLIDATLLCHRHRDRLGSRTAPAKQFKKVVLVEDHHRYVTLQCGFDKLRLWDPTFFDGFIKQARSYFDCLPQIWSYGSLSTTTTVVKYPLQMITCTLMICLILTPTLAPTKTSIYKRAKRDRVFQKYRLRLRVLLPLKYNLWTRISLNRRRSCLLGNAFTSPVHREQKRLKRSGRRLYAMEDQSNQPYPLTTWPLLQLFTSHPNSSTLVLTLEKFKKKRTLQLPQSALHNLILCVIINGVLIILNRGSTSIQHGRSTLDHWEKLSQSERQAARQGGIRNMKDRNKRKRLRDHCLTVRNILYPMLELRGIHSVDFFTDWAETFKDDFKEVITQLVHDDTMRCIVLEACGIEPSRRGAPSSRDVIYAKSWIGFSLDMWDKLRRILRSDVPPRSEVAKEQSEINKKIREDMHVESTGTAPKGSTGYRVDVIELMRRLVQIERTFRRLRGETVLTITPLDFTSMSPQSRDSTFPIVGRGTDEKRNSRIHIGPHQQTYKNTKANRALTKRVHGVITERANRVIIAWAIMRVERVIILRANRVINAWARRVIIVQADRVIILRADRVIILPADGVIILRADGVIILPANGVIILRADGVIILRADRGVITRADGATVVQDKGGLGSNRGALFQYTVVFDMKALGETTDLYKKVLVTANGADQQKSLFCHFCEAHRDTIGLFDGGGEQRDVRFTLDGWDTLGLEWSSIGERRTMEYNIIPCGLHSKQRIVESLLRMTLTKCSTVQYRGRESPATEKRFQTICRCKNWKFGLKENDPLDMVDLPTVDIRLSGDQADKILKNHEVLFEGLYTLPDYELWEHWRYLYQVFIDAPAFKITEGITTLILGDLLGNIKRLMPLCFTKETIRAWYIHVILEHLPFILDKAGSISLFSNQGAEAFHHLSKLLSRYTTNGGTQMRKGTLVTSDPMEDVLIAIMRRVYMCDEFNLQWHGLASHPEEFEPLTPVKRDSSGMVIEEPPLKRLRLTYEEENLSKRNHRETEADRKKRVQEVLGDIHEFQVWLEWIAITERIPENPDLLRQWVKESQPSVPTDVSDPSNTTRPDRIPLRLPATLLSQKDKRKRDQQKRKLQSEAKRGATTQDRKVDQDQSHRGVHNQSSREINSTKLLSKRDLVNVSRPHSEEVNES
ncbi:hypothetical protein PROFUN_15917 [Planoprotostelium fungivorum]|uniref:Uncharacterized protein n=1 Tax=Planoprotostelium fungivorum TaxID=1890364 RepID=A0A2P6MU63_9EUKA|nr:hypothetical protein PROFUN_15917 [Planoprotostelium fungivorum]